MKRHMVGVLTVAVAAVVGPESIGAQEVVDSLGPSFEMLLGESGDQLRVSGAVGVILFMGLLSLLPSVVLMCTAFTRVSIVLHLLRQALGTANAPPALLMGGLSMILTGFIMAPTIQQIHEDAVGPYLAQEVSQGEALRSGMNSLKEFMLRNVRQEDIDTWQEIRGETVPSATAERAPGEVEFVVVMSAFVTSELRTAFYIGFLLFVPMVMIDIIVSSILLSLGAVMLPPGYVSLPAKILLFVIADGWALLVTGLVRSFQV